MMRLRMMAMGLCCLLLVSCAPKGEVPPDSTDGDTIVQIADVAMGRYVEEVWDLPDDWVYAVAVDSDGRPVAVSDRACYIMESDGGWKSSVPPWYAQAQQQEFRVTGVSFNSHGAVAVSYFSESQGEHGVSVYTEETGLQGVPLDKETAGQSLNGRPLRFVQNLRLGDDGTVYVSERFTPLAFSSDGSFQRVYPTSFSTIGIVTAGEWVAYAVSYPESDIQTGEGVIALHRTGEDAPPEYIDCDFLPAWGEPMALDVQADGSLTLACKKGIFHRAPGGSVWEKLLDGSSTTLAIDRVSRLLAHGDNEYLVLTDSGKLRNYRYDPTVPTTPSTELTVYTVMDRNPTLDWAAYIFQQQHQDVSVRMVNLMDTSAGITYDDAAAALNTELLAGKGPDVIRLDWLPVDAYIDKGVLADLSGWMMPMMEADDILPNIAGAYAREDKIYAIPARFSVPTVWGQKDAIAACGSLSDLAAYKKAHPDRRLFLSDEGLIIQDTLKKVCTPAWVDGSGQVDEVAIAAFFTDCMEVAGASLGGEELIGLESVYVANGLVDLFPVTLTGFYSMWEANGVVAWINGIHYDHEMGMPQATSVEVPALFDFFAPMPGQAEGVFLPGTVLGVNANSPRAELAQEFLQCVVSEAVMKQDLQDGFPIHRGAIRQNIEDTEGDFTSYTLDYEDLPFSYTQPSREVLEAVAGTFDQLTVASPADQSIDLAVYKQLEGILAGDVTTEEAAAEIGANIRRRLAEAG